MHYRPTLSPAAVTLSGMLLLVLCSLLPAAGRAEKVVVSLSQEQDGGDAGRACIYVHQGKAEFRRVKADESCPSQITVEREAE